MQTTFHITLAMQYLQQEILKETGLSKTAFQRKAIDDFLCGNRDINETFKIKKRSDENYVRKPVLEQIYLDGERKHALEKVAADQHCGITVVLFQCIFDYCVKCAPLLDDKILQNFTMM